MYVSKRYMPRASSGALDGELYRNEEYVQSHIHLYACRTWMQYCELNLGYLYMPHDRGLHALSI